MDSILSQSIVLPLLLLLASSYASAHIPRLGVQRRASQNKPQQASTLDGLATFYYKQPLDHFNYQPQSYDTFDQRYVIDFKYWQGVNLNAPIIVGFGSEGDVEDDISFLDFPIRIASRYKAMLVYLEVRGVKVIASNVFDLIFDMFCLFIASILWEISTIWFDREGYEKCERSRIFEFGSSLS